MVTCVLLKVARMLAMPETMFLACLALTIFLAFGSSPNSSAAVGAAGTAASSRLGASARGGWHAAAPLWRPSLGGLASLASGAGAGRRLRPSASFPFPARLVSFFLRTYRYFNFKSQISNLRLLMDAGLGVRIALHADGLAGAFARAGVGLGALAAHRQAAQMADAAVTLDALEALEVHADFAAQITFNDIFALLNRVDDQGELLLGQILRANRRVNVGAFENLFRVDRANAVNVAQRDVNALAGRNFHTNNACHKFVLTLTLFVAFVRANDADHSAPPHDFAVLTQFFN